MSPELIQLLIALIEAGTKIWTQAQATVDLVKKLQAEGRDPTPEEIAELNGNFDAAKAELAAAIKAQSPAQDPGGG